MSIRLLAGGRQCMPVLFHQPRLLFVAYATPVVHAAVDGLAFAVPPGLGHTIQLKQRPINPVMWDKRHEQFQLGDGRMATLRVYTIHVTAL